MMFCFIGPALALLVLLLFLKRRHHHYSHFMPAYGYGGCGPGMDYGHHHGHGPGFGHGHGHGHGHGRRRGRGLVRALFTRLDTTPGQEKAIVKALDTLWEQIRNERDELRTARKEVAQSIGGEVLDHGALDAAFARHLATSDRLKKELTIALETVHAALDPKQRATLAEILAEGGLFGGLRGWR